MQRSEAKLAYNEFMKIVEPPPQPPAFMFVDGPPLIKCGDWRSYAVIPHPVPLGRRGGLVNIPWVAPGKRSTREELNASQRWHRMGHKAPRKRIRRKREAKSPEAIARRREQERAKTEIILAFEQLDLM